MGDLKKKNAEKKKLLAVFENNQERWLHSKDFLHRGEIAEKSMLYLRPVSEGLAAQKFFGTKNRPLLKHELKGETYC